MKSTPQAALQGGIDPAGSEGSARPGRAAPRYVALAESLLSRIARGEFPTGSQLPPERELARANGVAYLTARQAVGLLVKKGVITRRHGHGTFVKSASQKELVALISGPDLRNERSHFYRTMIRALESEGGKRNYDFRIYSGLTDSRGRLQPEESQVQRSLHADLSNYSFGGLVEISPGREGLWRNPGEIPAPQVIFEPGHPANDLEFDYHDFGRAAIRHLAERDCRRIAILRFPIEAAESPAVLEGAFDAVAELGLPQLKVRMMDEQIDYRDFERNIHTATLDLVRSWQRKDSPPPEGVIVADDIAMRSVALAFIQSGFASTNPIPIVCQACEGIRHHYGLPVSRYELQIAKAARVLLDLLKQKMEGLPLPRLPITVGGILKPDVL